MNEWRMNKLHKTSIIWTYWWYEECRQKQEQRKRRNTLGCLDQYAAQNSKYARPPIPSQPTTQKVFFQWHTQYDPTMKNSHFETVYAKELFQWLFFELAPSLQILSINLQTSWSH